MKYWIGTVSREHALNGVNHGFTQVCHGKEAPLKKMKKGDWFIFYSPKLRFQERAICQKFVGIGQIKSGDVYQFDMGGGFKPFRIDIQYMKCSEAPIASLIEQLSFIKNKKNWGMAFRYGLISIPETDFLVIAKAMEVNPKSPSLIATSKQEVKEENKNKTQKKRPASKQSKEEEKSDEDHDGECHSDKKTCLVK